MNRPKLSWTLGFLIGFILTFIPINFYQNYYMGDYKIENMWIGSEYNGQTYCNECLWIKFYAGCDNYFLYYFENQHELDERFEKGSIVNINFKEVNGTRYIKGILNAKKYRNKC